MERLKSSESLEFTTNTIRELSQAVKKDTLFVEAFLKFYCKVLENAQFDIIDLELLLSSGILLHEEMIEKMNNDSDANKN